jgi:hypothetical protein
VRANQAAESGDDELYVILQCVVSVLQFLDDDPLIAGAGLTRPLGMLAAALMDLGQGARPPLFFNRPKKKAGRPTDVSFEAMRGVVAAAVGLLIENGESRQSAARVVADELGLAGIKAPGGKSIQPVQILRWRDEIGSRASKLAESTYKDVLTKYATVARSLRKDAKALRGIVSSIISGARSMGF